MEDAKDGVALSAGGVEELHVQHLQLVDALDGPGLHLAGVGAQLHEADDTTVLGHCDCGASRVNRSEGPHLTRPCDLHTCIANGECAEVARRRPFQQAVLVRLGDDEEDRLFSGWWVQHLQQQQKVGSTCKDRGEYWKDAIAGAYRVDER